MGLQGKDNAGRESHDEQRESAEDNQSEQSGRSYSVHRYCLAQRAVSGATIFVSDVEYRPHARDILSLSIT